MSSGITLTENPITPHSQRKKGIEIVSSSETMTSIVVKFICQDPKSQY